MRSRIQILGGSELEESTTDEDAIKLALLVDDLSVTNKCTSRSLSQAGYVCHTANDGRKAVDMARKTHYDIIVMDVQVN